MSLDAARQEFRSLHAHGTFLMPNPFDRGSCRLLEALGFRAIATTSSGRAASLGRLDMSLTRDELVSHVASLGEITRLPVNVDAEQCFPESSGGVTTTVRLLARAGASGCSLEDWNPSAGHIEPLDVATERVAAAAATATEEGVLLTARAENHIRGRDDLADTIARLSAYREAGAHVVYAPGLRDLAAIARIVDEVGGPVNVLLLPGGPSMGELAAIGVRRLSIGGALASVAYGSAYRAAQHLIETGSLDAEDHYLSGVVAQGAFSPRG
jgi:2-methylisocitrate lyase-like PEP mutase family enzyme